MMVGAAKSAAGAAVARAVALSWAASRFEALARMRGLGRHYCESKYSGTEFMNELARKLIVGRAVTVHGNDIDTDRIIPARYLKCVVFDGLGEHAFEDDRLHMKEKHHVHPFDRREFAGASILFVNKNFGCGSSREHAPQALKRWGIKAIVGESFAEIFFGNCVALGIPCMTASHGVIKQLMGANESDTSHEYTVNVEEQTVSYNGEVLPVSLAEGPRQQFVEGHWDSTGELMSAGKEIRETAEKLPYFKGWK